MKYFSTFIFAAIIVSLIYAFQTKKMMSFQKNKTLSNLSFEGEMGQEKISNDPDRPTIIIWFHPDCENCQYQLNTINGNIGRLDGVRFFFITADTTFFRNKYNIKWPNLAQSSNVIFGVIEKSKFINEFGPVVSPSLLIFNQRGILKEKLYGEIKVDKILHLINTISVSEQMTGGSNGCL